MKKLLAILTLFTATIGFAQNNYSLQFDGVDDYTEAPSIANYDTIKHKLTISSWVKLDTGYSADGTVIARRNFVGNPTGERHHFELTVMSDKSLFFSTSNNQNNSLYSAQLQSSANDLTVNGYQNRGVDIMMSSTIGVLLSL